MKILAIRIRNLASLEGFTELNFQEEPLLSAGIYAITGPTGAGKSTILDALCLALYDNTPRYRNAEAHVKIADITGSTINQNDARGILRDGTTEGYAEVDFVGVDGQHYRAQWSVRRARNRVDGNLQSSVISLTNLTAKSEIPGKKTELLAEIEKLAGLNFEQFTRSVLLAQGDFTAFLKAGKDEKSSLLEKLTGTHIYSKISRQVYEIHSEQKQKLQSMGAQQEGIIILTVEELDELDTRIASLGLEIQSDERQLENLNGAIQWHEQLNRFREELNTAKFNFEQYKHKSIEAEPRRRQLQQVEYVQSIRGNVDEIDRVQKDSAKAGSEVEEVSKSLSLLQTKKKDEEEEIRKLDIQLKDTVEREVKSKPELDRARQLDVQLTERTKQIQQLESEEKVLSANLETISREVVDEEREWVSLEESIDKLEQWFIANESRRRIAENKDLVIAKLKEVGELYERINRLVTNIQLADNKINELEKKKEQDEKRLSEINNIRRDKQSEFDHWGSQLVNVDLNKIQNEKSKKDAALNDLIDAKANWERFYEERFSLKSLGTDLKENEKRQQDINTELETTNEDFQKRKIEREASLEILENARLAVSANLEEVRNRLIKDEPCPVCGSTHHPYVSDQPAYKHVLTSVEQDYKQREECYEQVLGLKNRLEQALDDLKQRKIKIRADIENKEHLIRSLRDKWEKSRVYTKVIDVIEEERTEWLGLELNSIRKEQELLQEQWQGYHKMREHAEVCKNELTAIDKEMNSLQNGIKDIERDKKTSEEQKNNDVNARQEAEEKLQTSKNILSRYFSNEGWFKNWRDNPATFSQQIEQFADDWNKNLEQKHNNKGKRDIIEEKVKGLNKQVEEWRKRLGEHKIKLKGLIDEYNKIKEQRNIIFGGRLVVDVEVGIKAAVDAGRAALESARERSGVLAQRISAGEARQEQLQKTQRELVEQLKELNGRINQWLMEYNKRFGVNQTMPGIRELLAFPTEWIEKETADLEKLDTALKQANSVLTERARDLENHENLKISELSVEELGEQKRELQSLLKQKNQEKIEAEIRVKNNAENKRRLQHILRDIEKQAATVEDWARLNELIGSADGKKFRQIAQEYTLDVLVSFANVHLDFLSKRYVLERVPDSLGLQVVDRDMGDEIRTVNSLSGGESFLVSLALALGLASLSSDTMRVESLFIDEGFGSLDPITLNVAMDALERLHNQGRKVGVISHVQEMTERIPVQIRVLRLQSGKSRVEVVTS